jgi:uncharacterized membrane protein
MGWLLDLNWRLKSPTHHLKTALILTITLLISNAAFTYLSIELGIQFYGYGFTAASILTSITGLHLLNGSFSQLEMRSFLRLQ